VRTSHPDVGSAPGPPLVAPRVSFNNVITPHRRFSFGSLSLTDVKAVKRHYGATVNDVVLALCAGALRTYLKRRNELPDKPLVAFVPVSVRDDAARRGGPKVGNRISGLWAPLPVQVADPVERLRLISGAMNAAKDVHHAIGADLLQDFTQFATPVMAARAARVAFRTKMAKSGRPIYNLVISNVPGPSFPLYLAGAKMEHWYPVSIINDAAGLNITVHSYQNSLDFGLIACRELVPELNSILQGIKNSLDELTARMSDDTA
jgi:diacylglycerol O-acyltransferase / wax synthase